MLIGVDERVVRSSEIGSDICGVKKSEKWSVRRLMTPSQFAYILLPPCKLAGYSF
jgi:hypothetical protein